MAKIAKPFRQGWVMVLDSVHDSVRPREEGRRPFDAEQPCARRLRWREPVALAGLLVLAIAVPLAIGAATGSLALPRIDDWSYRRVAEAFAATGSVRFTGWVSMTLVGQVLWSAPFLRAFGDHGWVFGASTSVLAAIGIASGYFIARRMLERRWAVMAVLFLVAAPGFASNTSTFMTDVPGVSAELLCLALGIASFSRSGARRWGYFAASLVAGLFAFSIRDFALAAPAAIVLCACAANHERTRAAHVALGMLELAACGALYVWWVHQPGGLHERLGLPTSSSATHLVQSYFTVALVLSPAICVAVWRRWRARRIERTAVIATAVVVVLGDLVSWRAGKLFVGDVLLRSGAVDTFLLAGHRPDLFPRPFWGALSLVGLLAGAVLAGLAVDAAPGAFREWRRTPWATAHGAVRAFVVLMAAGMALTALLFGSFYDRYLWPLEFAAGVLLLRQAPSARSTRNRWSLGVAAALLLLLLTTTSVLALNSDVYEVARWRAGELAVAKGVRPSRVDAGFEWIGAHSKGIADTGWVPSAPSFVSPYAHMLAGFHACAVVSGSRISNPHLRVIGMTRYRLYGIAGPLEPLFVYRLGGCGES